MRNFRMVSSSLIFLCPLVMSVVTLYVAMATLRHSTEVRNLHPPYLYTSPSLIFNTTGQGGGGGRRGSTIIEITKEKFGKWGNEGSRRESDLRHSRKLNATTSSDSTVWSSRPPVWPQEAKQPRSLTKLGPETDGGQAWRWSTPMTC